MKKVIIILISLIAIQNLQSQTKATVVKKIQFKIDILTPGLSLENGIGDYSTIYSELGTSLGAHKASNSNKPKFLISPYIKSQYRYYYNFEKRQNKGKNTFKNSGNFIAFSTSYYFKPISNSIYLSTYDGITLAPVWGLQRTYNSGLNINFNTGLGYTISSNKSNGIVPIINFTIGWVIGK